MQGHIKREHTKEYKYMESTRKEWEAAVQACQISSVMPTAPGNTPPPLYGLSIMKGVKCAYCNRCAVDRNSLRQHTCNRHGNAVTDTYMQQFNNSDSRMWFPVQPPPSVDDDTLEPEVQAMLAEFLEYRYQAPIIDDARMLSPWNMSTKWPIYTKDLAIERIQEAVALDKSGEYKQLKKKLREYLRRAEACIESTNRLVLQRLNTDDPNVWYVRYYFFQRGTVVISPLVVSTIRHFPSIKQMRPWISTPLQSTASFSCSCATTTITATVDSWT